MTASSMLERVYRAGYSREYVKLARSSSADMVLYDPIYAAAQQVKHRGGGAAAAAGAAREVRSKAWQKFLEASAPYRAGLTVGGVIGVPTGALQYAVDKDEKDPKKRWARAALAGTIAGLWSGHDFGRMRHRMGKQLQNASSVLEKQTMQGRVSPVAYHGSDASDKVYRGAIDAAVSGAPNYRARGGARGLSGKEFVKELPFSEVAEALRTPKMDFVIDFGDWGEEGARAAAIRQARRDLEVALMRGLSGTGAPARPGDGPKSELLRQILKNDPSLTPKQLRAKLHPDAVARTPGLDPAEAAAAFREIGKSQASAGGDPLQSVIDYGAGVRQQRLDFLDYLEKQRGSMFPRVGPEKVQALNDLL